MVHMTSQEWRGDVYSCFNAIVKFIDNDIPTDWSGWSIERRRKWWRNNDFRNGAIQLGIVETRKRDRITGAEIWCEFFNYDWKDYRQSYAEVINESLSHIPTLTTGCNTSRKLCVYDYCSVYFCGNKVDSRQHRSVDAKTVENTGLSNDYKHFNRYS